MAERSTKPGGILRLFRAAFSRKELSEGDAASTLFRFFRSRHVADLRLIFKLVFVGWVVVLLIVGLDVWFLPRWFPLLSPPEDDHLSPLDHLLTYFGSAVVVGGVIIGWAYQMASVRLGVVDLFACEISTLCRVGTAFDVAERYVRKYHKPPSQNHDDHDTLSADSSSFTSSEQYFPVFDNNSRDLQVLEALVVSHITEFYTYMKATRDLHRKLAAISPPQTDAPIVKRRHDRSDMGPWHGTMADVIYSMFLGYESGREAVEDLIEFQPTRAERTIVMRMTKSGCRLSSYPGN